MYLGEVPHNVAALFVHLCQNVEEKWLHIKVECLVVRKEFGQQTEILAVDLVVTAVHLKLIWCPEEGEGRGGQRYMYMYLRTPYTCTPYI